MARKTTPKPWQVADLNFVEIEITHRTDTQMRIEFGCGLRLVIASEEQIPLAALNGDLNGDGVSLLMAFALNLDPRLHLQSSLPAPVLDGDTLNMSFHAASPGITYSVETSIDLKNWGTTGVTMSGPDNQRTASVLMDLHHRFLRLVVQQ
jgi:hypothetical protein